MDAWAGAFWRLIGGQARLFPPMIAASYDSGMTGIHASTTWNSIASARKSAVWLLQLTGVLTAILTELAAVAYMTYILVTQPSDAWPVPVGIAFGWTFCLLASGELVSRRIDRARRRD